MSTDKLPQLDLRNHRPVPLKSRTFRSDVNKPSPTHASDNKNPAPPVSVPANCHRRGSLYKPDSPLSSVSPRAAFARDDCNADKRRSPSATAPPDREKQFERIVRENVAAAAHADEVQLDMMRLAQEWGIFVYRAEMIVARTIREGHRQGRTPPQSTVPTRLPVQRVKTLPPDDDRGKITWRFVALVALVVMIELTIMTYLST